MKKVIISKKALVTLVRGTCPELKLIGHPAVKDLGSITGAPNKKWEWDKRALKKLSEDQLIKLYEFCTRDELKTFVELRKDGTRMPLSLDEIEDAATKFADSVVFNLELQHGKYFIIKGKPESYHSMIKASFWKGEEHLIQYNETGNKTVSRPTTALKIARPGDKVR